MKQGPRGEVCVEGVPLYRLARVVCNEQASQVVLVIRNQLASAGNLRDMRLIVASGRSRGGGHDNLLQYSCLENPMDVCLGLSTGSSRIELPA